MRPYDANGNITEYLTASGAVAAHFEYSPFGEVIGISGTFAAQGTFQFSTKYYDEETYLVYYGLRYYSVRSGRWTGRDPLGERGGLNLYALLGNDAVGGWDYLGLDRQQPFDWHHNFPQVFKDYFKARGIDINNSDSGVLMLQGDHLAFKDRFQAAWQEFIDSPEGKTACADDIKKHFNEKIRPQFKEHYDRSAPAGIDYRKWSKKKPFEKLEIGKSKLSKIVSGLAVLGVITQVSSAAEWMNRENVEQRMSEFADIMAETDDFTKQMELTRWYRENFPGIADPMGVFSLKFGSKASEPWSPDLVARFKESFQQVPDDEP